MRQFKSAKIYFAFAVLLLVAKPFLGFTMLNRMTMLNRTHPPAAESILLKAFTKRKLEYTEDSKFNMDTIQKKLADPIKQVFLLFSFLLGIIFPALLAGKKITDHLLNSIQLSLSSTEHTYLLNRRLII